MRIWLWISLAVAIIGSGLVANIGSSMALADLAARPVLALAKADTRIPVQQFGRPAAEGEARFQGGTGVFLGYRLPYRLPNGEVVTCIIRFQSLTCRDGWAVERLADPALLQ